MTEFQLGQNDARFGERERERRRASAYQPRASRCEGASPCKAAAAPGAQRACLQRLCIEVGHATSSGHWQGATRSQIRSRLYPQSQQLALTPSRWRLDWRASAAARPNGD